MSISYVNKLFNRDEINEEQKKLMRLKAAQICRAYGLPKIHKPFQHLPKFRPIIDTINTPHHGIGKFLTSLLNPLAQNKYVDKFDIAWRYVMNILLYLLRSSSYFKTFL